jgi:eukaryotic-like serine/threonine-protein kinase
MECPSCQTQNIDNARFCAKCGTLLPVATAGEADPLIGQVIKNTFRIVRMVGEGGMGRVYEGEQQMGTKTRKVAIKTLHPDLSRDPQIVARFNRECGTVADLEHPNTIQFFDFGQTPDGTLFIAMEFLDGESVAKALETKGPMPPPRVERIMRQVCGSLSEAHGKGIIHRDLKPENVQLIRRAGEEDFVKVLDFGIAARKEATDAKKEQKLTQQGMVLGTPPYMSPEQFKGQELDPRSDIYSLGVMAYEMLSGKLPFDAATPWEWATKHLTERPFPFEMTTKFAASLPDAMKTTIMRALCKVREERQSNVGEFISQFCATTPMPVAPTAAVSSGTAQMAAPPIELLQQAPQQVGFGAPAHQPAPTANEMVIPVQGPYPMPASPPARAAGSPSMNKGLIGAILGGIGLLLIVAVVVAAKSLSKNSNTDDSLISIAGGSSVTNLEPVTSGGPAATAESVDGSAKVQVPKPTATATTTAVASSKNPPPVPQGEDACVKARALGENIEAAVAMFNGCKNGGTSVEMTRQAIRRNARDAAQHHSLLHQCNEARSAANSAASIGAGDMASPIAASCK